jgi:hypothetical protein
MGLGEVLKAIAAPAPEKPIASTSEQPATQRHFTRSQSAKALPTNAPTSKTSTSSPSKRSSRRRGRGTEKGRVEEEPENHDHEEQEHEQQPGKSDKGKGKEVARSQDSSSSSSSASSSSSDKETNANAGEKGELMIFQRTRSRSQAREDEKASSRKKFTAMAGRSVKRTKGTPLRLTNDAQRIIIDLTGDVSCYIDLLLPRLILLQEPDHEEFRSFSPPRVSS